MIAGSRIAAGPFEGMYIPLGADVSFMSKIPCAELAGELTEFLDISKNIPTSILSIGDTVGFYTMGLNYLFAPGILYAITSDEIDYLNLLKWSVVNSILPPVRLTASVSYEMLAEDFVQPGLIYCFVKNRITEVFDTVSRFVRLDCVLLLELSGVRYSDQLTEIKSYFGTTHTITQVGHSTPQPRYEGLQNPTVNPVTKSFCKLLILSPKKV